jgi:hypothetical protein
VTARLLCTFIAAVLCTAAQSDEVALSLTNYESTVSEGDAVWVLLVTETADKPAVWPEFASSLGRCSTASIAADSADGADLAKKLGVSNFPSILVINEAGAAPHTLADGTLPKLKKLRNKLKRALKGCEKNADGKFVKKAKEQCSAANDDIVFAVRSQPVLHEIAMADKLEKSLLAHGVAKKNVVRLDKLYTDYVDMKTSGPPFHVDYWVMKPWLPKLLKDAPKRAKWFVFLESVTEVDPARLEALLSPLDPKKKLFLGHKLRDIKPSIVHHYNTKEDYVFGKTGFVLSRGLVQAADEDIKQNKLPVDTHIEPFFDFSRWMTKLGASITHNDGFCGRLVDASDPAACATSIAENGVDPFRADFSDAVKNSDIVIGVKTTQMFHVGRLDVIKQTWGQNVPEGMEIVYLSDAEEGEPESPVSTVDLTKEWGAEVNQKKGHCAKVMA